MVDIPGKAGIKHIRSARSNRQYTIFANRITVPGLLKLSAAIRRNEDVPFIRRNEDVLGICRIKDGRDGGKRAARLRSELERNPGCPAIGRSNQSAARLGTLR